MSDDEMAYGALAGVYEWLVPEALLSPGGAVEAFAAVVGAVPAGGRVLDCACGTGPLAVGLALQGFAVVASDASPAMVERTARLAAEHGADVRVVTCRWDQLGPDTVGGGFDAVFCVGNSITHAEGRAARRAALEKMASVLRLGGVLALTSRNWELIRRRGSGLEIADRLVERHGRPGLVVYHWDLADEWDAPHSFDVAVALLGPEGAVTTSAERLTFWPFTYDELTDDLRRAGLTPVSSTYADDAARYVVTARR